MSELIGREAVAKECERWLEKLRGKDDQRSDGARVVVIRLANCLAALPPVPATTVDVNRKCFRCHGPLNPHPAICGKCLSTPQQGVF